MLLLLASLSRWNWAFAWNEEWKNVKFRLGLVFSERGLVVGH